MLNECCTCFLVLIHQYLKQVTLPLTCTNPSSTYNHQIIIKQLQLQPSKQHPPSSQDNMSSSSSSTTLHVPRQDQPIEISKAGVVTCSEESVSIFPLRTFVKGLVIDSDQYEIAWSSYHPSKSENLFERSSTP
jgi:hypothetical protein